MQVGHFAKPNDLESNAFKKSPEIRQIAKPNICSQTLSKLARCPEFRDKFANLATLVSQLTSVNGLKHWEKVDSQALGFASVWNICECLKALGFASVWILACHGKATLYLIR